MTLRSAEAVSKQLVDVDVLVVPFIIDETNESVVPEAWLAPAKLASSWADWVDTEKRAGKAPSEVGLTFREALPVLTTKLLRKGWSSFDFRPQRWSCWGAVGSLKLPLAFLRS